MRVSGSREGRERKGEEMVWVSGSTEGTRNV
jgi:hypothetical protein